jgi:hypothetical protein
LATRDHRLDATLADEPPVLVVVVGAVGEHALGTLARLSTTHRRGGAEQRDQLGDVVAVAARDREGERDPGRIDEEVLLGTGDGLCSVSANETSSA